MKKFLILAFALFMVSCGAATESTETSTETTVETTTESQANVVTDTTAAEQSDWKVTQVVKGTVC